jgi:hypothetical protein
MTLFIAAMAIAAAPSNDLQAPFKVLDGDKPISVDIGHAAPLYVDIDGDGKKELLVGQFGDGKLRIYKNQGTDKAPLFKGFDWFRAGGQIASVPCG